MMAGSGINAKPSEATEESMEGLSLKVKSTPSRAPRLEQRRDHGSRGLRKVALRRHLGAEIGQGFHGSQQPPQIVFLHSHARMRAKDQSRKRVTCGETVGYGGCWLVWC